MRLIKNLLILILVLIVIGFTGYHFRHFLLRQIGDFLIYEDQLQKADIIVVLSGNALDRGREASKLFHEHYADTLICSGISIPSDLRSMNLFVNEAAITKRNLLQNNVPESNVKLIEGGTSTFEESGIYLSYCLQNHIKTCILVTSKFHSRRAAWLFKKKYRDHGIEVIIHTADDTRFDEEEWWRSEFGLIAVNNEYIKIIYYSINY